MIPGLTDYEVPAILKAAYEAGARSAHYVMLRLPHAVKSLFEAWLERHYPDAKQKVLNRVMEVRGGKLYNSAWGSRMKGEDIYARQIEQFFNIARTKAGFKPDRNALNTAAFRPPAGPQLTLFEL
jgi:DNA repair photolyase